MLKNEATPHCKLLNAISRLRDGNRSLTIAFARLLTA